MSSNHQARVIALVNEFDHLVSRCPAESVYGGLLDTPVLSMARDDEGLHLITSHGDAVMPQGHLVLNQNGTIELSNQDGEVLFVLAPTHFDSPYLDLHQSAVAGILASDPPVPV